MLKLTHFWMWSFNTIKEGARKVKRLLSRAKFLTEEYNNKNCTQLLLRTTLKRNIMVHSITDQCKSGIAWFQLTIHLTT